LEGGFDGLDGVVFAACQIVFPDADYAQGHLFEGSVAVPGIWWFDCSMRYKVELRYIYGWDDAGWTEEDDAGIRPMRFRTVGEAEAEIESHFADVKAAVAAGNMDIEETREDYRIVEMSGAAISDSSTIGPLNVVIRSGFRGRR
jgi:hypothetical protein